MRSREVLRQLILTLYRKNRLRKRNVRNTCRRPGGSSSSPLRSYLRHSFLRQRAELDRRRWNLLRTVCVRVMMLGATIESWRANLPGHERTRLHFLCIYLFIHLSLLLLFVWGDEKKEPTLENRNVIEKRALILDFKRNWSDSFVAASARRQHRYTTVTFRPLMKGFISIRPYIQIFC